MESESVFEPIEKKRLSAQIVDQLRHRILSGGWKPGEKLPPERELSRSLGVTRVSLREALRTLEGESLIETRHGEGSLVRDFTHSAGLSILKYLMRVDFTQGDILRGALELRAIVGTELCRMAAERATEQNLSALDAIVAEEERVVGDPIAVQRLDFAFFVAMADASQNIVIKLLLNSTREIYLENGELFAMLVGPGEAVVATHRAITEAVRRRDAAEAARLGREYLTGGMTRFFGEQE